MKIQPKTPSAAPAPAKSHTLLWVVLILGGFFFFSIIFLVFAFQHLSGHATHTPLLYSSDQIDLIEINGPIYQSDEVVHQIKKFRKSSQKALLVRLDSPGGVVAPSQEIYSEILKARKDKKIVVASMGSLAASGAYYIASACDKIVANPGTLTGSIGVIFHIPEASGLLKKVGVSYQTIKSGKFKDTGSFDHPMSPEEKAYIQGTINEVYQQFLDAVVDGRREAFQQKVAQLLHRKPKTVTDQEIKNYITPYADGRILTGEKASQLGFVDQIGGYEDAVDLTAQLAGIKGEPTIHQDRPSQFEQFLKNMTPLSALSKFEGSYLLEYRAF
ncbi:MAG TPA: signal peptide peptidase SppA [bacterium]|nr:signal peptide peptidase SppA [bacterium]